MSDFVKRVEDEHKELSEKYKALGKFLLSDTFYELGITHRTLLEDQYEIMYGYLLILGERLELFDKEKT